MLLFEYFLTFPWGASGIAQNFANNRNNTISPPLNYSLLSQEIWRLEKLHNETLKASQRVLDLLRTVKSDIRSYKEDERTENWCYHQQHTDSNRRSDYNGQVLSESYPFESTTNFTKDFSKNLSKSLDIDRREGSKDMTSNDLSINLIEKINQSNDNEKVANFADLVDKFSIALESNVGNIGTSIRSEVSSSENIDAQNTSKIPFATPSSLCSFNICADNIDLFSNGAAYHHISNVHAPIFPNGHQCKLSFLISTMPYSGVELQMTLLQELMGQLKLKFRGHIYWNFHAHSKLNNTEAGKWVNAFNNWSSTLRSEDFLIIRTPYKDDKVSNLLCEKSVIVNGFRSLVDIALLRVYDMEKLITKTNSATALETNQSFNQRDTVEYIRTLLLHQRHWNRYANFNLDFKKFLHREEQIIFLRENCINLLGQLEGRCDDNNLFKKVIESGAVSKALFKIKQQEKLFSELNENRSANIEQVIRKTFRSQIER